MKLISDISYGDHKDHTFDVYHPESVKDAPVIFMVHGGAWSGGDKANSAEVDNKVNYWVKRGYVLISTNYRNLPEVDPLGQVTEIEKALLFAQQHAQQWGGAADKFILMGHSSGAHLVSLLSANLDSVKESGVTPWLATISLDISGYDVAKKVLGTHPSKFFKEKFGDDVTRLKRSSPFHVVKSKIPPFLAVCSTLSVDACSQAEAFTQKLSRLEGKSEVIRVDMSHGDINSELGKDSAYTAKVDGFIKSLNL